MNDKQMELIMQIVREQLSDYLAAPLVEDLCTGISDGILDNLEILEKLAEVE